MNVFVEKIIKKEKNIKDTILKILIVIGAVIVCLGIVFFTSMFEQIKFLRVILIIIVGYFTYVLVSSYNIEYEYSLTSTYFDIDKIMSQRRRKKIISIDLDRISIIAPITYPEHITIVKKNMQRVIYAVESMDYEDIYYMIASIDGNITLVYFHMDERMLEAFETYVKSKLKN